GRSCAARDPARSPTFPAAARRQARGTARQDANRGARAQRFRAESLWTGGAAHRASRARRRRRQPRLESRHHASPLPLHLRRVRRRRLLLSRQLAKAAQRPDEVSAKDGDRESVGANQIDHRASPALVCATIGATTFSAAWSVRNSMRYLIAIITAARTSVHAIVMRNATSIRGGRASLSTTGPGC